jgi:hypothetical protein
MIYTARELFLCKMGEAERIKKLLEKLDELRKSGVLTEEEYAEKRDLLLKQLKNVERRPPRIPQLLLVLATVVIIFIGIFVAVTPVKVPVSYMTTAQTIAYAESYTTLKVPIIERASAVIKPGYILAIRLDKYSLVRLPSSGTLYFPTMYLTEGETMVYPGYSQFLSMLQTMTTFKPATTTETIHLTEMVLEYGGKSYKFLKDEPMIVANVSVSKGVVDFLLLDEKNYMKLQQSSYQPIYVMSNIRGPLQFEFKPPSPDEILGDEVYFVFLPKGGEGAEVQYEVNAVWEVIEKVPTTTTTTLYTTSEYVGAPLIETGISIILLGMVLLAIFIFWRTARR